MSYPGQIFEDPDYYDDESWNEVPDESDEEDPIS